MNRWAVLTVVLYGIILLMLSFPLFLVFDLEYDAQQGWQQGMEASELAEAYSSWGFYLWLAVLLAGQALLLLVPMDIARERPIQRRRLRVPVITTAFFLGNLFLAGVISVLCAAFKDDGLEWIAWPAEASRLIVENFPPFHSALTSLGFTVNQDLFIVPTLLGMVAVMWAIWGMIFHHYAKADDAETLLQRATRWLLRGSILEFLIAVPSHIIVRQRDTCCAPAGTFWGMTTGLAIMVLAFGPGVFYLFVQRMGRLRPKGKPPTEE